MAELKPANENPWYVLSTLHGEYVDGYDKELAEKNIWLWNIWSCSCLQLDERDSLRADGFEVPDENIWELQHNEIVKLFKTVMASRNNAGFLVPEMPRPDEPIDLEGVAFRQPVVWENAYFPQTASFVSSSFQDEAIFDASHFARRVSFVAVTFAGAAYFGSARFKLEATFGTAAFRQNAHFQSTDFEQEASFVATNFEGACFFEAANFTRDVFFHFSRFEKNGTFDSAHFHEKASFIETTFLQDISFHAASFDGLCRFVETTFGNQLKPNQDCQIDFRDTVFSKPTSFRDTVFFSRFPNFSGTLFHEKTQISAHESNWPSLPQPEPKVAKEACSTLRHLVAKQSLPEDEYFFFRQEMMFAQQANDFWTSLPYRLYSLSDYGTSIKKPVLWLAALWLLPALVYLFHFAWRDTIGGFEFGYGAPFGFSFANIFNFFGLQRAYFVALVGALPNWILTIAAFQTVLGYILLFFLGLGLRARFRLR